MKKEKLRIVPMRRALMKQCSDIAAVSEPWKTLGERLTITDIISPGKKSLYQALVGLKGTAVAGFIIFSAAPVFARGGYIRAIAIAPAFRRLGLGLQLLLFAERVISRSALNVYLCVSSFNKAAQLFYKRAGYARVGTLKDLILPGISEYIYWKRIGKPSPGKSAMSSRQKKRANLV